MYNLTAVESATDLMEFVIAVNDLGDGMFMGTSLLVVFVVAFIMLKGEDNLSGLLYASYLTSIIAIFFRLIGFIDFMIMAIPLVLVAIFIFMKIIQKD